MITLRAGSASVDVDRAHGGRLASLVVNGLELLVSRPTARPIDPLSWGLFPMVPFAGRLRGGRFAWHGELHELERNHAGHAMHGTLFDERWTLERRDPGYARIEGRLHPRWPYEGWAVHEVSLRPDSLELRLEVHAASEAFPATAGWHPWFRKRLELGGDLDVDVRATRFYPRGPDGLPLGPLDPPPAEGPWDDCFTGLTWPMRLSWPNALELSMTSTCDHVVLYDLKPHAVCLEPQSGPPDAPNLGRAYIVRPDEPLVVEMQLTWQPA